jgi:pimeloyl-ACP methyl ester carboxylesterase
LSVREGRVAVQDGKRIYYRDYGPRFGGATPVLCLTGLTRNSKDFHRLAGRLSAGRRVICPDYRGRGRSDYDKDWRNYAAPSVAYDLIQLLTALDLGPVVVIGTSLGGMLAMVLAAARPLLLAGALINDAGPVIETGGLDRIKTMIGRDRVHPDWDSAVADLKQLMYDAPIPQDNDKAWMAFAKSTWRKGEDGLLHYDFDTRLGRLLDRTDDRPDLWALYRALAPVPVAAVRGGISDILTAETLERMAEARGGDLIAATVPGVGHAPNLDEPQSRQAIEALLARADAERSDAARGRAGGGHAGAGHAG